MNSDFSQLATFTPNKSLPIYNWFYYKEGFSRELVNMLLDRHTMHQRRQNSGFISPKESGCTTGSPRSQAGNTNPDASVTMTVLDPFCGVGTTMLACKERGIDSHGIDVSPLAVLASRAKTNDYGLDELKSAIKVLQKSEFRRQDMTAVPGNVRRYFNPHTLEDVLFFRGMLEQFEGRARDFIELGLITSATRCSWLYKDGAALKIRKRPVPAFRKFYIRTLRKMLSDLQKLGFRECKTTVEVGDARDLNIGAQSVDLVITSPPYLNKIEYTKVYSIEEFLFFGQPVEKRGMRAFIGLETRPETIFPELPPIANAYFSDMVKVLKNLRGACKPGAAVCMVIGDGCLPEMVVHVDALLPGLAESEGFSLGSVEILGARQCTRNRVENVGQMEECLLTFNRE